MIVNVVMLANQPTAQIYPITVKLSNDEESLFRNNHEEAKKLVLNRAFHNGNLDNRPHGNLFCSISVGDVAILGEERWLCSKIGWKQISIEEMHEYCNMPRRDRMFSELLEC